MAASAASETRPPPMHLSPFGERVPRTAENSRMVSSRTRLIPACCNQLISKRAWWATTRRPRRKSASTTSARAGTGRSKTRMATPSPSENCTVRTPSEAANSPVVSTSKARKRSRGKYPSNSSSVAGKSPSRGCGNPRIFPSTILKVNLFSYLPTKILPETSFNSVFGLPGCQDDTCARVQRVSCGNPTNDFGLPLGCHGPSAAAAAAMSVASAQFCCASRAAGAPSLGGGNPNSELGLPGKTSPPGGVGAHQICTLPVRQTPLGPSPIALAQPCRAVVDVPSGRPIEPLAFDPSVHPETLSEKVVEIDFY